MYDYYLEEAVAKAVGERYRENEMKPHIREWSNWYCGKNDDFHTVEINNGVAVVKRPMYKLKMAKKVAEDWADLILNEKTFITANETAANEFLNGCNGNGGILTENGFRAETNRLIEKAFALGTGAITVSVDGAGIGADGRFEVSPKAKIRMDYIGAENIFPISYGDGKITEIAFAGSFTVKGRENIYVQLHRLEGEEYVIYSRVFEGDGSLTEIPLPENVAPMVRTGSDKPWFVLIKPNSVNNLCNSSPMGISVFASATDILKGIDLCYDSMNMEFYLGKKMVFLRKDMLEQDNEGNYYSPQDSNRQLFMYVGDKNIDGDMIPKEFNPELRVDAHTAALRDQLRYLAAKCGLGERSYGFEHGNVTTATQVISENSAMFRRLKKHELAIENEIIRLMKTLLYIGKEIIGIKMDADTAVTITFDDSIIEDRQSNKKNDLELVREGLMLPYEFRMKYFGEDEITAKEKTERKSKT